MEPSKSTGSSNKRRTFPVTTKTRQAPVTNKAEEKPAPVTVESTATGPVKYTGPDTMSAQLLDRYTEFCTIYTTANQKLLAAEGDRSRAVEEFIKNSDHPSAIQLRDVISKAQAKLSSLAEAEVVSEDLSEEEKTKLRAERDSAKENVNKARVAITSVADTMSPDPEGVRAALEAIGNPTSSNRGRKPGSTGSSLPRARATLTVSGGNVENKVFESFSKAALFFTCEVKDLQLAYASAAGVSHEDIKTVDKTVVFEFQPNDNGAVYKITAEPRHGNTKKAETASESTSPESTDD